MPRSHAGKAVHTHRGVTRVRAVVRSDPSRDSGKDTSVRKCRKYEKEKHIMTNKLRALFAFSAIAVTGAALPAFAADTDPIHVTVPFAFKAGKASLPAGEYVVIEEDSGVIIIKGNKGSAMVLGMSGAENTSEKAGMSFERNEKGYVLKTVHGWGRITSSILPVSEQK
jgi:hypothetical protein